MDKSLIWQFPAISKERFTVDDNPVFLLKSMKQKHLESTLKTGTFCFNHPRIFNDWEDQKSAQFDKWDSYSAYRLTHIVVDPEVDPNTGIPDFEAGIKIPAEAALHLQSPQVEHTPVCCFRCIRRGEVEVIGDEMYYSLGDAADRIEKEFGHDAYIIVPIKPFMELFSSKVNGFRAMEVVYLDYINDYPFLPLSSEDKEIVEQVFRKDKIFDWHKEYRIALSPTDKSCVFRTIGSIEKMAVSGMIKDLKEKRCIYRINSDN